MKATAEKIGNNKERILVDGDVFIKSTAASRWNFIVVVEVLDGLNCGTFTGKSATREAAEKWLPFPMSSDVLHPKHCHPEHREEQKALWEKAIADGAQVTTAGPRGFRQTVARIPTAYTRKIYKIERVA